MTCRDFEKPGRSEAVGANGMVATSHPRATLAAIDILRAGGNAVDAAVCAAAVQAVVEPTQTGIGGDCFALLMREGDDRPIALDGAGWSPRAANLGWYQERGIRDIEVETPHAVTVPGAIAAWERLVRDHGALSWSRVLAAAIELAEEGCCVPERLARDWSRQAEKLRRHEAASKLFLIDGATPRPGAVHRQPALAATLRTIASEGAKAFYEGRIAEKLVATLRAEGGLHTADDFAEFAVEYVTPICVNYRGYVLWECPPSGQGLVPMMMAKALEGFPLCDWSSSGVERLHVQAEIGRQSYAARDQFIGDPRTGDIPVDSLLSDAHAAKMRANVSMTARISDLAVTSQRPHRDTVFIAVVDRDRMAVSLINSVFEDFGSGIACAETGVLFHNRASSFTLAPGHANCIDGRKRPLHTIIPAMLTKDGRSVMPFGVTGAHFQPFGQIQILLNVVDYGMSIQAAIDHPRSFARGDTFELERSIPESVADELRKLGHTITRPDSPLGTAQAIWINHQDGILRGGADPRRDGIALGY